MTTISSLTTNELIIVDLASMITDDTKHASDQFKLLATYAQPRGDIEMPKEEIYLIVGIIPL